MKILGVLSLSIVGILVLSTFWQADVSALEKTIRYESYNLQSSVVHTLSIPPQNQFVVTLALSQKLDQLEKFAQKYQAIAALNGGFFDPVNHKTTSYIVRQGKLIADPRLNERLIHNPNLAPKMQQILNRTEFRRYQCGQTVRYDITPHSEATPTGCQLIDAVGGGPGLLPKLTLQPEAFLDISNGKVIHDALGSLQPNARTAVGITHNGSVVWVMVAQSKTTGGMSLAATADFMKSLGIEKAMNLDGGSSSALYYQGKTFYGKMDKQGKAVKRPVKSVLLLQAN